MRSTTGFVEEHAGEQGLVEARLEFVCHDHEAVILAFETLLDQLALLQLIDGVLADGLVVSGWTKSENA